MRRKLADGESALTWPGHDSSGSWVHWISNDRILAQSKKCREFLFQTRAARSIELIGLASNRAHYLERAGLASRERSWSDCRPPCAFAADRRCQLRCSESDVGNSCASIPLTCVMPFHFSAGVRSHLVPAVPASKKEGACIPTVLGRRADISQCARSKRAATSPRGARIGPSQRDKPSRERGQMMRRREGAIPRYAQFAQRASSASTKARSHRPSRIAWMVACSFCSWASAFSMTVAAREG